MSLEDSEGTRAETGAPRSAEASPLENPPPRKSIKGTGMKAQLIPMEEEELIVDWGSGKVQSNLGERKAYPERRDGDYTAADRARQQAEEILGKFDLPAGLPPEVPWRVRETGAPLPDVIMSKRPEQEECTNLGLDPRELIWKSTPAIRRRRESNAKFEGRGMCSGTLGNAANPLAIDEDRRVDGSDQWRHSQRGKGEQSAMPKAKKSADPPVKRKCFTAQIRRKGHQS